MDTKTKPVPDCSRGTGLIDAFDAKNYISNHTITGRFCTCRRDTICIVCLTWHRLIRRIENRRMELWGAI